MTDSATTSVDDGTCSDDRLAFPIAAQLRPSDGLSQTFNGENLEGHWTLEITDGAMDDSGTLHQWCMSVQTDYIFADNIE